MNWKPAMRILLTIIILGSAFLNRPAEAFQRATGTSRPWTLPLEPRASLSASELQRIIRDAGDSQPVGPRLGHYLVFTAQGVTGEIRQNGQVLNRTLTLTLRTSHEQFVVITRTDHTRVQENVTDVVGFDETAQVCRRWRIWRNGQVIQLVAGADDVKVTEATATNSRVITINWQPVNSGSTQTVSALEEVSFGPGAMNSGHHLWSYSVTRNQRAVYSEKVEVAFADRNVTVIPPKNRRPETTSSDLPRGFSEYLKQQEARTPTETRDSRTADAHPAMDGSPRATIPDRTREKASGTQRVVFRQPTYGIEVLADSQAVVIPPVELRELLPAATFGFLSGTDTLVLMTADLQAMEVEDAILTEAILGSMGMQYPGDVIESRECQHGTARGREFDVRSERRGRPSVKTVRVLRNGTVAVGIVTSAVGPAEDIRRLNQLTLDQVRITTPAAKGPYGEGLLARHHESNLMNAVGVVYYSRQNYRKAAEFARASFELDPFDAVRLENAVNCLIEADDTEQAVALLTKHSTLVAGNESLRILEVALLKRSDRLDEAVSKYQELFDSGIRNEDMLLEWANTLVKLERAADAVKVVEQYIAGETEPSVNLRRWRTQVLMAAGESERAVQSAESLAGVFPEVTEIQAEYVETLLDAKRYTDVLKAVHDLRNRKLDTAEFYLFEGLAQLALKHPEEAKEAFEAGAGLAPGDSRFPEWIAAASALLGQGDNSSIKEVIEPVPVPAGLRQLLNGVVNTELDPGYGRQCTEYISGHYYRPGERRKRTEYRTFQVVNQAGVNALKTIQIPFNPTHERIFVNSVQVLNRQNQIVAEGEVDNYYVQASSDTELATGDSTLSIPVPGLTAGHTLKYVFTVEDISASDEIQFEQAMFASTTPGEFRAWFITGDLQGLREHTANAEFETGRDPDSAWWVLKDAPRLVAESLLPSPETFLPMLVLSNETRSWEDLGQNYLRRLEPRMQPDAIAEKTAGDLMAEAGLSAADANHSPEDLEARCRVILEWVRKTLVYQGIEFGTRAQLPNTATKIIQNRYGDCKDHSLLAWHLLKACGVPCHLALVHSSNPVLEQFPALDQFDHMIVYIPDLRGGTFIDCTSGNQSLLHTAVASMADQQALVLDPQNIRLERIQKDPSLLNQIQSLRLVELDPRDQDFLVSEELTMTGSCASSFRAFIRNLHGPNLKSRLQTQFDPGQRVEVLEATAFDVDQLDKPFRLSMKYRIRRALRNHSDHSVGRLPALWETYFFENAFEAERVHPFELTTSLTFESTVRWTLPAGRHLDPESLGTSSLNTSWISCESQFLEHGGEYEYQTRVVQHSGIYPASEFSAYRDATEHALDTVCGDVRIRRSEVPVRTASQPETVREE